jgi:zinc/manganese transport system substrate-binding protein
MKRVFFILLAVILALSTASCTPSTQSSKKSIVVTYSILGSVVKDLVGDQADVIVPMPNGLDPHEWQPSAKDIERFNKADLVVENGLGLESGMSKTLDTARNNGVKFFTASDHIVVRHVGSGEGIPAVDPDQAIGAPDPHLWMDPMSMKGIVAALADELKNDFGWDMAARAADLETRLDTLNSDVAVIVAGIPPDNRKLVTGHESMGYFAQRYGFKLVGVIIPSLSSQAGVSAGNMAALKVAIQANPVNAIFTEIGTSPAEAKTIGDETGVKVVPLTTHALPADGSYFTFLKNLATTIANALK